MALSRRHFLLVLGGGTVMAAGAAAGFALTREPSAALTPWSETGRYTEPRRFALSHAILAPNPHNLQSWLVDLREHGIVTLYPDPSRRLPETDPFDRQLTIGLGCFLEQMTIAAANQGYAVETELFPAGEDAAGLGERPVARSRFIADSAAPDPLFTAIAQRRSNKQAYAMNRPVPASALADLAPGTAGIRYAGSVDATDVEALRELAWQAWMTEYTTPAAHLESVNLMRMGKAEINASPDGISIGGALLEALMLGGVLTREAMATPGTMGYQAGIDRYEPMIAATPAFVWLASPANGRTDQIAAGRAWLRLNLATTLAGLALHPVSQCLQEYPAMAAHHARAHTLLARSGETVQMLGRLGYAGVAPRTPRWSLDARLKPA